MYPSSWTLPVTESSSHTYPAGMSSDPTSFGSLAFKPASMPRRITTSERRPRAGRTEHDAV